MNYLPEFDRDISGYLAYVSRYGQLVRYSAYMSDLGEAFRPLANKWVVRGTYGISWAYVAGDVIHEGYRTQNDPMTPYQWRMNVAKRATFQSIASMALPMLTIHSVVHFGKDIFFPKFMPKYIKWGPTFAGLAVIPFLPLYDHPVEHVCDYAFGLMGAAKHES